MPITEREIRQSINLPAKKRFFKCADRLSRSRDPEEQKRLKEELARMTFGE